MVACVVIATLIVLVAIILWRSFGTALKVAAMVYVALVAVTIVANLIWEDVEWQAIVRATFVVCSFVLGIWAGVISRLSVGLFGRWSLAGMTVLGALASGQVEGASRVSRSRSASVTSLIGRYGAMFETSDSWFSPIVWCADRELASSTPT
jgi:hypothetical protein